MSIGSVRRGSISAEVICINHKLFIVEGLPGSGKSSTAEYIAEYYAMGGERVQEFKEDDLWHPADYTFHAYMNDEQIKTLSQDEQRQLFDEGTRVQSGHVIPLTRISVNLFGKVIPYKIYDKLNWEIEKPIMLDHWLDFTKKALLNSCTYVFNCCLLQNPLSETLMRFDLSYNAIRDYILSIYRVIASLSPVVIYLKCTDIRSRVQEVAHEKNSLWLDNMIDYHTSQGFGKRNGLTGFDGYIDCLEARQRIELKILDELPIEKLIITDPYACWDDTQDKIDDYISRLMIV